MFDKIAEDWNRKRKNPWYPFNELAEKSIKEWKNRQNCLGGELFLDLGAGSGRNSPLLLTHSDRLIEVDESFKMLKLNESAENLINADMVNPPFRKNIFDGVFSIAAFHHIKGEENRNTMVNEIKRVGIRNGFVCVTVWRLKQDKFQVQYSEKLRLKHTENYDDPADVDIPWTLSQKDKNETVKRFYHLFMKDEFKALIKDFKVIDLTSFGNKDKKDNLFFSGIIPE